MAAKCVKCSKNVGCSCGLKNGLCATCQAQEKQIKPQGPVTPSK